MNLYVYGNADGKWYAGRSPTGRVKYTEDVCTATFFSADDADSAEDCIELGLDLYVLEISSPQLVKRGTTSINSKGASDTFKRWEIHSMDLFGQQ